MITGNASGPYPDPTILRSRLAGHQRKSISREGYRRAAVLIPLLPRNGDWDVLLTRRTSELPHHRGQIAFPGGSVDGGENCEMTALREAQEEIGLDPAHVDILGCHDDIRTPTGFIISPVIGIIEQAADLHGNPAEVARIFRVPLSYFCDEEHAVVQHIEHEGRTREVHFYEYDGETIWGATALMLRNMLVLLDLI